MSWNLGIEQKWLQKWLHSLEYIEHCYAGYALMWHPEDNMDLPIMIAPTCP